MLGLNVCKSFAYDVWLHRAPDYLSSNFNYRPQCKKMNVQEIERTFSAEGINFNGAEIDVLYKEDLGELIVYHGQKGFKSKESVQCFDGKYVLAKDFIEFAKDKYGIKKFWIDLKNRHWFEALKAVNELEKIKSVNLIVESRDLFTVLYVKFKKMQSSLWLQVKGKSELTKRLFIKIVSFISPSRVSQHCRFFHKNNIFKNYDKMCWNTPKSRSIKMENIDSFEGLKVLLIDP